MFNSEKRLFAIEILLSIIFLLNIFLKNILNEYSVFFILLVTIGIIAAIMGYEPDQNLNGEDRRKLMTYVVTYCLGFIIFEYGLGLILNYLKSPYKRDLFSIFSNIISTLLIIFSSEYLRYMIVKKGEKNKPLLIYTIFFFILIDMTIHVRYYDLKNTSELLEYGTVVFLPSLFRNIMLTIFSYRYGMRQNILYRLLLELYVYLMPFTPDLGLYLESVLLMIFPMFLIRVVGYGFEKEKKKDYNSKNYVGFTLTTIVLILTVCIISLNSNLFRFWMAVVGSGSMEPTINVGDVVIVDKSYRENLNKLEVGDVLVFKIGKNIYTHRVMKITVENKEYSINTKGDRRGQAEDSWVVTSKDVIGVVKYKMKYIGYPTVWLSRILEDNNG